MSDEFCLQVIIIATPSISWKHFLLKTLSCEPKKLLFLWNNIFLDRQNSFQKALDRRDYCHTIIGFYVTEFVTENVTDCDMSWLTWHPLLNISNHSNTPLDSLTCRRPPCSQKTDWHANIGGSESERLLQHDNCFLDTFLQFILSKIFADCLCVHSQIPLPQVWRRAWNKRIF